jgi:hypothetical protein
MGDVAQALAIGARIEYQGKTYTISPWTYKIQGQYERYLEQEAIKAARRISAVLPADEGELVLKAALRDVAAGAYTFGSPLVGQSLQSLKHLKQLLLMMLLENHPEATMDLVEGLVKDKLAEVMESMTRVNDDPKDPPTASPPATS